MGTSRRETLVVVALTAAFLFPACNRKPPEPPDHPRLTPGVVLRDVTFFSASLNRDMHYRIVLPAKVEPGQKLPAVYLLHGGGGNLRDWTNYSDVARFAEQGLILVMPEGDDSYYTNAVDRPQDRYEDYIVKDLIADVETRFPAAHDRRYRTIAGVSMGGFGAIKLGMRHPDLFVFAGGMSSALDVPTRPFSIKRVQQWRYHRSIFGAWNGQVQRDNDPFTLARRTGAGGMPYLFLTCGDKEGLLEQKHFLHEFHVRPGGHDWNQWNGVLPDLFAALSSHAIGFRH